MVALPAHSLTPLHLTRLATFWLVLKSLVGEEKLLPCCENELRSAVHTLQDPVPVLHSRTPLPEQGPTPISCEVVEHREACVVPTLVLLLDL
jgi:hypothetical protein